MTLEGTTAKADDKGGKGGFDYQDSIITSKDVDSEDGAIKTLVASLFVSIASI